VPWRRSRSGDRTIFLLLEDLTLRGAEFRSALDPALSPGQMARQLDLLAQLHAKFWQRTDQLSEDNAWLGSLIMGAQFEFFDQRAVTSIAALVQGSPYRQDLLTRVGRTPEQLWVGLKAVQVHQTRAIPQTLLHGDTGRHNTYLLPDGGCGFLDWQFSIRGAWSRDVHYIMCTGLSVADRRQHERALLEGYLNRLADLGVRDVSGIDEAMREYARAIMWGFTIGWLMVPERNYGMEIISANLERLYAAMCDHDTFALAYEVMA